MDNDIQSAIDECHQVYQMSRSEGWKVIRTLLDKTLDTYSKMWMTMNKERLEFDELRIEALACQKMIDLIESYDTQRKKLEEHWIKVNNPEYQVTMDVDNETGLKHKGELDEG